MAELSESLAEAIGVVAVLTTAAPRPEPAAALAHVADLLANVVTDVAAVWTLYGDSATEVGQLQEALTNRVVVEQAKGMLAARAEISTDVAWARLRRFARNHNQRAAVVAASVVEGTMSAEDAASLMEPL